MRSLFSQLFFLLALLLGQHQSWAENNCQHIKNQAAEPVVMDHSSINHAAMNHDSMSHEIATFEMNTCCDDCQCDVNTCQNSIYDINNNSMLVFDGHHTNWINQPTWLLKKHNETLLKPPTIS